MCTSGGHTKVPPNSCWGPFPCFWGLGSFWGVKSWIFKSPKISKVPHCASKPGPKWKSQNLNRPSAFWEHFERFWRKIKIYQSYFHQVAYFSLFGLYFVSKNPGFQNSWLCLFLNLWLFVSEAILFFFVFEELTNFGCSLDEHFNPKNKVFGASKLGYAPRLKLN